MWKRHRALNALAGDNMSATQIDHMGGPLPPLQGVPAALRYRGELCHLVNERGETGRRVGKSMSGTAARLFRCTREAEGEQRGTRGLKLHSA